VGEAEKRREAGVSFSDEEIFSPRTLQVLLDERKEDIFARRKKRLQEPESGQ